MPNPTYPDFESSALAEGFDQVLVREWDANLVLSEHRHPFAVKARVARGELRLDRFDATPPTSRLLREGDTFELAADVPHAEHYGAAGATLWVARRHPHAAAR
jgi:quercetin dioxygenase-like cupin family protein